MDYHEINKRREGEKRQMRRQMDKGDANLKRYKWRGCLRPVVQLVYRKTVSFNKYQQTRSEMSLGKRTDENKTHRTSYSFAFHQR